MKKILLLLAFVSMARGLCFVCFGTTIIGPKEMEVLGTVELLDVIRPGAKPLAPGAYKLAREWVGTIVPLFDDRQPPVPQTAVLPHRPEPLRFNCLVVAPDGAVHIEAVRFDEAGRALSYDFMRFRLPGLAREPHGAGEILKTCDIHTLKSWFGQSGWGDLATFEHWKIFSPTRNETLVCQDFSARVSGKLKTVAGGDGALPGKIDYADDTKVKFESFSEGIFHPANPDSEAERRMYPSENEKYLARPGDSFGGRAWREKANARIAAYPEPLRSFAKAFHSSGSPGFLPSEAAINRFREKPDPLLIRQLVARLDNGDYDMPVFLQRLIGEDAGKYFPNFVPWNPAGKKIAIEALIDSLPEAPRYSAVGVIVMILAETSLVTLEMDEPGFALAATVFQRTAPATGGYGYSACLNIKDGAGAGPKAVLTRIAGELRRRWEAGGFCVERYCSPDYRPAEPAFEKTRRKYLAEYEKPLARLAKANALIDAQPEPLRSFAKSLNASGNASGDSATFLLGAAISRFRDKPDPLLVRQLVERLDTPVLGKYEFLLCLMCDGAGTIFTNAAPWKPGNKKIAIESLIDSLPEAPESETEFVIAMILAETSLAALKMEMDEPGFSANIEAIPAPPIPISCGHGWRPGLRIKDGADRKAVLTRIAGELRRRWEAGGFCVECYRWPVDEE